MVLGLIAPLGFSIKAAGWSLVDCRLLGGCDLSAATEGGGGVGAEAAGGGGGGGGALEGEEVCEVDARIAAAMAALGARLLLEAEAPGGGGGGGAGDREGGRGADTGGRGAAAGGGGGGAGSAGAEIAGGGGGGGGAGADGKGGGTEGGAPGVVDGFLEAGGGGGFLPIGGGGPLKDAEDKGLGASPAVLRRFAIEGIEGTEAPCTDGRPGTGGAAPIGGLGAEMEGGLRDDVAESER